MSALHGRGNPTPTRAAYAPTARALSRVRGCGATIVAYHRITDEVHSSLTLPTRRFRAQLAYLRRFYRVVPLAEIIAVLRDGGRFTDPTIAITFDDGYRDNLTNAAPILREYGCPATLFVATAPQEQGELFWWDLLALAGRGSSDSLARLKSLPYSEFRQALAEARSSVPIEELRAAAQTLYMTWDEIRAWRAHGFDLGAHTVTHPIMAMLSPEQARAEVRGSRDALAEAIDQPITTFAYPNGRPIDFTAETSRVLAEEGFTAACTTIGGINYSGCDLLTLRRFSVVDEPLPCFAARISRLGLLARQVKDWRLSQPAITLLPC